MSKEVRARDNIPDDRIRITIRQRPKAFSKLIDTELRIRIANDGERMGSSSAGEITLTGETAGILIRAIRKKRGIDWCSFACGRKIEQCVKRQTMRVIKEHI